MVVDSNLKSLLDSAVKTAVYRLATSPDVNRNEDISQSAVNPADSIDRSGHTGPLIDRSRVDFLYYDGAMPEYEYYYYDEDYNELERFDIRAPQQPPPWVAQQSKFNKYSTGRHDYWHRRHPSGYPATSPAGQGDSTSLSTSDSEAASSTADKRQDTGAISRVGDFLFNSPLGALLPLILAAPFLLFGLYYLLVVNAPTPVVKERMVKTATSVLAAVRSHLLGENTEVSDSRSLQHFIIQAFLNEGQ